MRYGFIAELWEVLLSVKFREIVVVNHYLVRVSG